MKTKRTQFSRKASQDRGEIVSIDNAPGKIVSGADAAPRHQVIKLALDVHADFYMVVRQIDNAAPQPAQKFTPEQFLEFARKQLTLSMKVYSCYEAGCFGYGLHRRLAGMGVMNLVIRPVDWDKHGRKVKTDRTDATAMLHSLAQYTAGNTRALSVVRVPSVEEEVVRSRSRERETFKKERKRWESRGRSLLLEYGLRLGSKWWTEKGFENAARSLRELYSAEAAEPLVEMLDHYREQVQMMQVRLVALTRELKCRQKEVNRKRCEADGRKKVKRPVGIGELSTQRINAEICDWNRFSNRRQVASYTGLCPGVEGTGGDFRELSINHHGNPRLREALVELAWLVWLYQPTYRSVKKWKEVMNGKRRSARKKAIVAIARQLAVDLWRIETGRTTAEKLGLKLAVVS